jgi:two-component system LytT family response regulator
LNTAIIIDDSTRARSALKRDIEEFCSGLEVKHEADSVVSGLKLLKNKTADILFLDIHMGDGDGFDLLELLGQHDMRVIFTTSSDAHAIKAFKFSAVDYLLKPIDPDELVIAVNKALESRTSQSDIGFLREQLETGEKKTKIALSTAEKIQVFQLSDIVRCESDVNYTQFFFKDGSKLLVTKTLKYFDQLLSESGFYRVHQSHLINLDHVKEYQKNDGGYILMQNNTQIPISSRKKAEVVKVLLNL